ncbi:MAG: inositol monophosphatase [Candidatus Melainabacteria bacterium]|nr:inositol monophosphatase [Candidatus Melainabacteria bacterium]
MTTSSTTLNRVEHLQVRFDVAQKVIREAGELANDYFKKLSSLTIKSKGSHDLVSEADLNTELLIKESFAKHFPDDAFFGEETGASAVDTARGIWVVDPIDGTQPFLFSMPNWCISIAYILDGVIEFGLIYSPPVDELFVGGKNFPATVNGVPMTPNPGTDFSAGLVSIGYSSRTPREFLFDSLTKLLDNKGMFFRNGSGALSLVYVACGRLLGHVEPHMHSWDCFGAIAIIEAAGGKVNPFVVSEALLKGTRVVAGTVALHDQLETLVV